MFSIAPEIAEDIFSHAKECYPRECCGVVALVDGKQRYVRCRNDAIGDQGLDRFVMNEQDYMSAEDLGEVIAVVHSHPNASANPSDADISMCNRSGIAWVIIGVPSGVIRVIEPKNERLPLIGRNFYHGVVDCYSLIRDYYHERLDINLKEYSRQDDWWSRGEDLYVKNFEDAGFVAVGRDGNMLPNPHDVILMQIRQNQLNHGAVMDAERPGHIIHHLHGHLSRHDVWGGIWARHTGLILRHKSLLST